LKSKIAKIQQKLENVAIANALQLEAARRHASDSPLHAKFEVAQPILFSYSVFAADILLYAMTLTLTFDLKHLQCIAIRL